MITLTLLVISGGEINVKNMEPEEKYFIESTSQKPATLSKKIGYTAYEVTRTTCNNQASLDFLEAINENNIDGVKVLLANGFNPDTTFTVKIGTITTNDKLRISTYNDFLREKEFYFEHIDDEPMLYKAESSTQLTTPLLLACEQKNTALVKSLLEAGANPNKNLYKEVYTSEIVPKSGLYDFCCSNTMPREYHVTTSEKLYVSPLSISIEKEEKTNAKLLLKYKADIESGTKQDKLTNIYDGWTQWFGTENKVWFGEKENLVKTKAISKEIPPLQTAITRKQMDVAHYLIAKGANVENVDKKSQKEYARYLKSKGVEDKVKHTGFCCGLFSKREKSKESLQIMNF